MVGNEGSNFTCKSFGIDLAICLRTLKFERDPTMLNQGAQDSNIPEISGIVMGFFDLSGDT